MRVVISVGRIQMPCIDFFSRSESYYATLAHWTRPQEHGSGPFRIANGSIDFCLRLK
jgi:hypothetical protein